LGAAKDITNSSNSNNKDKTFSSSSQNYQFVREMEKIKCNPIELADFWDVALLRSSKILPRIRKEPPRNYSGPGAYFEGGVLSEQLDWCGDLGPEGLGVFDNNKPWTGISTKNNNPGDFAHALTCKSWAPPLREFLNFKKNRKGLCKKKNLEKTTEKEGTKKIVNLIIPGFSSWGCPLGGMVADWVAMAEMSTEMPFLAGPRVWPFLARTMQALLLPLSSSSRSSQRSFGAPPPKKEEPDALQLIQVVPEKNSQEGKQLLVDYRALVGARKIGRIKGDEYEYSLSTTRKNGSAPPPPPPPPPQREEPARAREGGPPERFRVCLHMRAEIDVQAFHAGGESELGGYPQKCVATRCFLAGLRGALLKISLNSKENSNNTTTGGNVYLNKNGQEEEEEDEDRRGRIFVASGARLPVEAELARIVGRNSVLTKADLLPALFFGSSSSTKKTTATQGGRQPPREVGAAVDAAFCLAAEAFVGSEVGVFSKLMGSIFIQLKRPCWFVVDETGRLEDCYEYGQRAEREWRRNAKNPKNPCEDVSRDDPQTAKDGSAAVSSENGINSNLTLSSKEEDDQQVEKKNRSTTTSKRRRRKQNTSSMTKNKSDAVVWNGNTGISKNVSLVPKQFWRVWKTSVVPKRYAAGVARLQRMNPFWKHSVVSDAEADVFLQDFFPGRVYAAYQKINPRFANARADLLRYCLLYAHGGVYLDLDTHLNVPADSLFDAKQDEAVFTVDYPELQFRALPAALQAHVQSWRKSMRPSNTTSFGPNKNPPDTLYDNESTTTKTAPLVNSDDGMKNSEENIMKITDKKCLLPPTEHFNEKWTNPVLAQSLLISRPKHPFFRELIDMVASDILNYREAPKDVWLNEGILIFRFFFLQNITWSEQRFHLWWVMVRHMIES